MTRQDLLEFMRGHSLVVQTSVSPTSGPQAAVVGAVVTDAFEIVFDTLASTRKVKNLRANPKIAFVYIRARPTWIRYSDFNEDPPVIVEFTQAELTALR